MTAPARRRHSPEERTARVEELTGHLNAAIQDLTTNEQWIAWLTVAAKFRQYSANNVFLLWMQAAQRGIILSHVAGFQAWKALGRSVRKGEQGLKILAPIRRRITADTDSDAASIDADGPETGAQPDSPARSAPVVTGFKVEHVWDLSQTDGNEITWAPPALEELTGQGPAGLWEAIADQVRHAGYEIRCDPPRRAENGSTNVVTHVVNVRPDLAHAHAVKTLIHELAHIRAEHATRNVPVHQREAEAESIAYVVATTAGLDTITYSAPYVDTWSQGDPEVIRGAAATIQRVSNDILDDIEERAARLEYMPS